MQNFVIESCDPDERQIFVDVFAAEDKPRAIAEWELQRGSYAVMIDCWPLADYINAIEKGLAQIKANTGMVDEHGEAQLLCRYADCQYPVAGESQQVTCPQCRVDLGLEKLCE
jgi:hypothetical protein